MVPPSKRLLSVSWSINFCHTSELVRLLSDLLGVEVATGSIVRFIEQCPTQLELAEMQIKATLTHSD
jgi:hypothetical protein